MIHRDGHMRGNEQRVQMFGWRVLIKCIMLTTLSACFHCFRDAPRNTSKLQNRIDDTIWSRLTSDKDKGMLTVPIIIAMTPSGPSADFKIAPGTGGAK